MKFILDFYPEIKSLLLNFKNHLESISSVLFQELRRVVSLAISGMGREAIFLPICAPPLHFMSHAIPKDPTDIRIRL